MQSSVRCTSLCAWRICFTDHQAVSFAFSPGTNEEVIEETITNALDGTGSFHKPQHSPADWLVCFETGSLTIQVGCQVTISLKIHLILGLHSLRARMVSMHWLAPLRGCWGWNPGPLSHFHDMDQRSLSFIVHTCPSSPSGAQG